jgi:hypothetical protein
MPIVIEMTNIFNFYELIGNEKKKFCSTSVLEYRLFYIDLIVDTYLANIIFDLICILKGFTSHRFSHDD